MIEIYLLHLYLLNFTYSHNFPGLEISILQFPDINLELDLSYPLHIFAHAFVDAPVQC